jgi:hypothetical protein
MGVLYDGEAPGDELRGAAAVPTAMVEYGEVPYVVTAGPKGSLTHVLSALSG